MDRFWDPILGGWTQSPILLSPRHLETTLSDLSCRFDDDLQDLDATEAPLTLNPEFGKHLFSFQAQSLKNPSQGKNNQGRRQSVRFTPQQKDVLKTWLRQNAHNPYPNAAEKGLLALKTKLTTRQVEVWLSNARKRDQNLGTGTCIPAPEAAPYCHGQTPMERYLSSSEEEEAANPYDIEHAIEDWDKSEMVHSDDVGSFERTPDQSDALSALSQEPQAMPYHRVSSASSMGSAASFGSRQGRRRHVSHPSNFASPAQKSSTGPRADSISKSRRVYSCSHCFRTFSKAYDCRRHENSSHLGTERWICRLHEVRAADFIRDSPPSAKRRNFPEPRLGDDGLFHCPQEAKLCEHPPTLFESVHEQYLVMHTRPYQCKDPQCMDLNFASEESLFQHELEHLVQDADVSRRPWLFEDTDSVAISASESNRLQHMKWSSCASKPQERRFFLRKDKLVQHLRSTHGLDKDVVKMLPLNEWVDRTAPS